MIQHAIECSLYIIHKLENVVTGMGDMEVPDLSQVLVEGRCIMYCQTFIFTTISSSSMVGVDKRLGGQSSKSSQCCQGPPKSTRHWQSGAIKKRLNQERNVRQGQIASCHGGYVSLWWLNAPSAWQAKGQSSPLMPKWLQIRG